MARLDLVLGEMIEDAGVDGRILRRRDRSD
jgi:hypothetical protein